MTTNKNRIFLIGFMGTGKTTIGQILAKNIGMEWLDLDCLIEQQVGETISDIFTSRGERWFRNKETEILEKVSRKPNIVLSTGGGVVLNPNNIELMKKKGMVVALTAEVNTLWERLKGNSNRPLLQGKNPKNALVQLYIERETFYNKGHFSIQVDNRSPENIAEDIIEKFHLFKSTHLC
ncbi:MAG: shikimate kinase [Caldicoprobacterales bacterium]|jgi:shikimate kinase